MERRSFLRLGAQAAAAASLASLASLSPLAGLSPGRALAAGGKTGGGSAGGPAGAAGAAPGGVAASPPGTSPLLVTAHGLSAAAITRAAVDALGGMGRFVRPKDRVVVKPNIGWDRLPEHAANTNPEVVAALVKMCLEAGARSVLVMDNPCNDPRRCYQRSGIAEAARAAGATVDFFEEDRTRRMALNGEKIKDWEVHPAVIEAEVRINVPVAKHHGLAGITLGMKNWLGSIGGARGRLHQEMEASVVDLAAFFRPQLTVIDAVRILTKGGPQGGSVADVLRKDLVIASADPVAAEARGVALFDRKPSDFERFALAERRSLGRSVWRPEEERVLEIPGA